MIVNVYYYIDSNVGQFCNQGELDMETGCVFLKKIPIENLREVYREFITLEYNGERFDYNVGYEKIDDDMTFAYKILSYENTKLYKIFKSERLSILLNEELSDNNTDFKKNKC